MFFKPKKNHRIEPAREESALEIAASAILLVSMFYILTVMVFSL